jgi:tryptophanyl-tRNA synthetase
VLLQSVGFATPKEAGQAIARLQTEGPQGLKSLSPWIAPLTAQALALAEENLLFLNTFQAKEAK